ncbi:ABC transporter ATP-binding protein [Selenomonas ruminantium]|uniref:Iron complex transport system ATP-binding protein n=1 Tax=Selenomonas ruminantium TaxID=971 RepID=A0A1H0SB54_SELRU|nr:ABC transporter ATP-binding protein [Selenomonas ruminantium]SDP38468.1 iron complex transport system ATP-binding protein [Selenomonas ruminantium]
MADILLDVQGLQAGYGGRQVLREVSFRAGSGELIGLIGPNGAGKSTLLKSLRGLLPAEGHIKIKGKSLGDYIPQDMARVVAYLPQHSHVPFAFSVREVVLMGRAPHLRWWQREGKQDVRIADAAMEYMAVTDLADKPVNALSGGQRQRVLLAKILAQQTPLLFLDEPASGLDIFYQEELFRFCRELCQAGRTILLVVHDLALAARFCSRLLLLGGGRLLADGKPQEVLQTQLLSQAYGVPVFVDFHPVTGHADIYTRQPASEQRLLPLLLGGAG